MKIYVSYFLRVYQDGRQVPSMEFPVGKYADLSHLANGHLLSAENVKKELEEIHFVLQGKKDMHSFGGDEWCILDVHSLNTMVSCGLEEFEPYEVLTSEIVNVMQGWYDFLSAYENFQIPGLEREYQRQAHLDDFVGRFAEYFGGDWAEHREKLEEDLTNHRLNLPQLRFKFEELLKFPDFNWKKYLYYLDFFLYHEAKTAEELLIDLKLLCWDLLFPEKVLSTTEQSILAQDLTLLLQNNAEKDADFDTILQNLRQSKGWQNLNNYELLRLCHAQYSKNFTPIHELGSNKWRLRLNMA